MSTQLEIIPTVASPLTPKLIMGYFGASEGAIEVSDAYSGVTLTADQVLTNSGYTIKYRENSYFLSRSPLDDVHPAIEYLEGESSSGIDIKNLAQGWERAGFSYHISPDNKFNDELKEFILLTCGITEEVKGAIMFLSPYYGWCRAGLYTAKDFLYYYKDSHRSLFE